MAKLNRDDHKKNDIGAKIVKVGVIALGGIASIVVGSKIKDANSQVTDEENNQDDDVN